MPSLNRVQLCRTPLLLLCLSLIILCFSAARPAHAAQTHTVNSDLDTFGTAGTLRTVINNANAGDTIVFSEALNGQPITLVAEIIISKNLIIDASKAGNITINGAKSTRLFRVFANVTFKNLILENGQDSSTLQCNGNSCGGAIYIDPGATVNISNSTLNENSAVFGGGIFNRGTLTISNSTLSDNTAVFGGGIYNSDGTTIVNNSTINDNRVDDDGGGIYNSLGTTTVSNSTLSENLASFNGGGIYNNALLIMKHNTFNKNSAPNGIGGGIYNNGTLNVSNTLFVKGSSSGKNCDGSGVGNLSTDNLADDSSCTGTLTSTANINLGPLADNGCVEASASGCVETHALQAGSFAINKGGSCSAAPISDKDQRGAARDDQCDVGAFEVVSYDCTQSPLVVTNNMELADAIGCYNSSLNWSSIITIRLDDDIKLTGSLPEIDNNNGVTLTIDGNNKTIDGDERARIFHITLSNPKVTINNITLMNGKDSSVDCFNESCGGGILIETGAVVILNNSILSQNSATNGGGIGNFGTLTINNSFLENNIATNNGGGIGNYATLTISNSTLEENGATNGGGIYNSLGTTTVSNSTLSDNFASFYGGGIYNNGTLKVINSTLTYNEAAAGGGIFNNISGHLDMNHSTLSGNSASIFAGGIYNNQATLNVSNTLFVKGTGINCYVTSMLSTNNLADDTSCTGSTTSNINLGPLADNGCLEASADGCVQTHALLANSAAINTGGDCSAAPISGKDQRGVTRDAQCDAGAFEVVTYDCDQSPLAVTNNIELAEAIDCYKNATSPTTSVTIKLDDDVKLTGALPEIDNNVGVTLTINGNNKTIDGDKRARIFFIDQDNPKVTINNITLMNGKSSTDCYSKSCGGGILIETGAVVILNNSTLNENSADIGGGISNFGKLTVTNSTLSSNSSTGGGTDQGGGGIFNSLYGELDVINSTLSSNSVNSGEGGGISNIGILNITNSTLSGNLVNNGHGGAIYNYNSQVNITNSTLNNNSANNGNGGAIFNDSDGTLILSNSTLSNNSAQYGGGILTTGNAITVTNSTLNNNSATVDGGGIYRDAGTTTVRNTLFVKGSSGENCYDLPTLPTNNLADDTSCTGSTTSAARINLGPLTDNGCVTKHKTSAGLACVQTHALLAGSAAIDKGTSCTSAPVSGKDQRGVTRDATCDSGAYETIKSSISTTTLTLAEPSTSGSFTLSLSHPPQTGETVTVSLSSSDTSECTVPASVTFTAAAYSNVSVAVSVQDDSIVDGAKTCSITTGNTTSNLSNSLLSGIVVANVTATVADNEVALPSFEVYIPIVIR